MFLIKKIISNPLYYLSIILSLLRGSFYILYFYLFNRKVKIKFPFLVSSRVIIKGPGYVDIGARCIVLENVFKGLTIITYSKSSRVEIGNKCMLAGLTIRCTGRVLIGNNVMTAVSLVQNAFFAHNDEARTKQHVNTLEPLPITIGSNAWLGGHCIVLGGTNIGDDSVVSAYTVCSNETINGYSLITGNPTRKPLPIEQLLKLRNIA